MKTTYKYLGLFLSLFLTLQCTEYGGDEISINQNNNEFRASVEASTDSRTALDGGVTDLTRQIHWQPKDSIGITTNNIVSNLTKFVYDGLDVAASVLFTGDIPLSNRYYAIYPYRPSTTISTSGFNFLLPSVQDYAEGSFARNSYPMVAETTTTSLSFNNLCGILELNIKGNVTISRITFSGVDNAGKSINVAGDAFVGLPLQETPSISMQSGATDVLTLDCGDGVELKSNVVTPFFIVLPPATYESFTLTITSTVGIDLVKEATKPLTISRSKCTPTAALDFTVDPSELERAVLMDIYNSTNGDNWSWGQTNWGSEEPIGTWEGVGVENGYVTQLKFGHRNLTGNIPSSIKNLKKLESLNLGEYPVPDDSRNKLTILNLSGCVNLERLNCIANNLISLDVSGCVNLKNLSCYDNNLISLNISGCDNLNQLQCYTNLLTSLDIRNNKVLIDQNNSYYIGAQKDNTVLTLTLTTTQKEMWDQSWFSTHELNTNIAFDTDGAGASLPDVTTAPITSVGATEAISGGQVIYAAQSVTSKGIVWDVNENPTIELDTKTVDTGVEFVSNITGLTENTTYYVRAYATNSIGTAYGEQLSFITVNEAEKAALIALYNATDGANWVDNTNWNTNASLETWHGVTIVDGSVTEINLRNNKLIGVIHNLGDLTKMTVLNVGNEFMQTPDWYEDRSTYNDLTAVDVSNNTALLKLNCENNPITTLDISNCTALLELNCNTTTLSSLDVTNNTALTKLNFYGIGLHSSVDISKNIALVELNCSSCQLGSLDVSNNRELKELYCDNNDLTSLNLSNNNALITLYCNYNPLGSLDVTSNTELTSLVCDGNELTSLDVSKNTKLLTLFCAGYTGRTNHITTLDLSNNAVLRQLSCGLNMLESLDLSKNYGLQTLSCDINLLTTLDLCNNSALTSVRCGNQKNNISLKLSLTESQKNTWDYDWMHNDANANVTATAIENYESIDYSKDGEVLTLQEATVGNGINIVIVGDAFSDKDMGTGGAYERRMKEAMEHFFSEEPYKTYRNRYNVYCVKAVSKHEVYGGGAETAFSCWFGNGTLIGGNDNKIYEYALKVPTITSTDDLTVIGILNSPKYAGTCYMYFANNASISYCPVVGYDDEQYRQIVTHEAGGHGFAKLADEYAYTGHITWSEIDGYNYAKTFGWYENTDITNDPATIRWSHFLTDPLYANLVGIYEGALTFEFGAYRPTDYSIMRSNVGGYNAPSRESIYKNIMRISGEEFTYDNFVEYDAINRTPAAMSRSRSQVRQVDMKKFIPLAPPVVIK